MASVGAVRRILLAGFAAGLIAATCTAAQAAPKIEEVAVAGVSAYRTPLPPLKRIAEAPVLKLEASRRTAPAPTQIKAKKAEKVTRISGYSYCGSSVRAAQRCIDQGKLTLYYPAGVKTLAGHNYMGWYWMDDLPVGRKVVIASGGLKGTYRVYGHGWAKRGSQGGKFPKSGLKAAVALQTCTSNGTGFSFLKRI